MTQSNEDAEGGWEPDIDAVTADTIFHDTDSAQSRVDFEIAFFTVILTLVLAYPSNTAEYSVIKGFLVLFAVLVVIRRVVVMTEYSADATTFMTSSKELMVDISTLGVLYIVVVLAETLSHLSGIDFLLIFAASSVILAAIPATLYSVFARDDIRLDMVITSSQWAHQSPIRYWRRYHRNKAIREAQKINRTDDELPDAIVALRKKNPHRIFPFPNETAQLIPGILLRLARWSAGAILGWSVFQDPLVSLTLLISITAVGSQIHRLYRRYGLEGYRQRPSRKQRQLIQALTIFVAHPLLLV